MYGRYLLIQFLISSFKQPILAQGLALAKTNDLEGDTGTALSDTPPKGNDLWIHSVIFEPLPKIKLTRSSYQVTTFLDFQPFLKGFNQVKAYIDKFIKDLNNPNYVYVTDRGPSAPAHGLWDSGELCRQLKGAVLPLVLLLVRCLR